MSVLTTSSNVPFDARAELSDKQRSARTNGSGVIVLGDFEIDLGKRTTAVRGQKLILTAAEFDVLLYGVFHQKKMVASGTALATKSEYGAVQHTEFIPALLSLRRKLQEVGAARYLEIEAWILYEFHFGA